MHRRHVTTAATAATATTLTAAVLASTTGALAPSAHAAPPAETTAIFVDPLPCQPDRAPYEFTLMTRDGFHEQQTSDRYHENSRSTGTFTATPVEVDEHSGEVSPRPGPTWSGRMVLVHSANNGTAGKGHAVATFRLDISATSDSGERLHLQELAHYTGTAVPDDATAVIRRFFQTSTCR